MNNDLKDEYSNEGDREEQIKEEKINKFQKGFVIFVIAIMIVFMLLIMFTFLKSRFR